MGDWPWASFIGGEILAIGIAFALIGAGLASIVWWLA